MILLRLLTIHSLISASQRPKLIPCHLQFMILIVQWRESLAMYVLMFTVMLPVCKIG